MEHMLSLLDSKTHFKSLIHQIWRFYMSERLLLVKILRSILEGHTDATNAFAKSYSDFISSLSLKQVRNCCLAQIELLQSRRREPQHPSVELYVNKHDFVRKSCREQLELLLLIIATMVFEKLSEDEFCTYLQIFYGEHDYGKVLYPQYVESILDAQLAICLVGFESAWYVQFIFYKLVSFLLFNFKGATVIIAYRIESPH